jgi:hypothetical protein
MTKRIPAKAKSRLTKTAKEGFVRGLLLRKEAARSTNGKLPSGATHEIVDEGDNLPVVRRRRFSLT